MQKIALITGSSKGIGKSITKLLLKNNFKVFGYSRTNQIKDPNFIFYQVDLSNLEEVQKITFPKISTNSNIVLVNNAATIGDLLPLEKKSIKEIIKDYNLNIITPTIFCRNFLESYEKEKKLIINIGSGAANKSVASWSTYCAAKSALDRLTDVICEEKHKNLKTFSFHPGVVNTGMQCKIRNSKKEFFPLLDKFKSYYKNNELASTEDIAEKIYNIIQYPNKYDHNIITLQDFNIR